MTIYELSGRLDALGITLVNMDDPVTGDPVAALDWEQVAKLIEIHEADVEAVRSSNKVISERNRELRRLNLEAGGSLNRIWGRVVGSEQPESSITVGIADRIIAKLDEAPSEDVEITDGMVEAFIASAFAPSVVVSRDSVRLGLANALQTR